MNEVMIHTIIKMFFINFYIFIVNFKILNMKIQIEDIMKMVSVSFIISTIYYILQKNMDKMLVILIMYIMQLLFLKITMKNLKNSLFVTNMIANAIVYIMFEISLLLELILAVKVENKTINFFCIMVIEVILLICFFRIKRFKNGFSFLQNNRDYVLIEIIMINISSIVIVIYYLFGNYYGNVTKQLVACLTVLGLLMLIIIQKTLTLYYKQKLMVRNIEDMKNEIAEKDRKIKELSDEKYKISKLNHEFDNRQKALKLKLQEFINNSNIETGDELSILSDIENLSKEYVGKIEEIKNLDKLPTTEIDEIDDMFRYMQVECKKNNIDFKLQVNGNIHHMVNKLIPQNKLVTLIGDHLKDAIIALNASDNKFRSIFAFIGKKEDFYEFSILDSGIEFENNTLLKLGLKPITTHKDNGGTGFGFMTTFETMKETKASLIIEEKHEMTETDYTKSVTIRFDGKNEYRISSYKAKEILKNMKDNRIILDFLK